MMSFSYKKSGLILFSVLLLAWTLYLNSSYYILRAAIVENDRILFRIIVRENEVFALNYQHSISKTIVEETYRIAGNNKIEYDEFKYSAVDSGLPLGDEYIFRIEEDGTMVIKGKKMSFKEIDNVRIATNHPHYFIYNNYEYNLYETAPGKTLKIRVSKF